MVERQRIRHRGEGTVAHAREDDPRGRRVPEEKSRGGIVLIADRTCDERSTGRPRAAARLRHARDRPNRCALITNEERFAAKTTDLLSVRRPRCRHDRQSRSGGNLGSRGTTARGRAEDAATSEEEDAQASGDHSGSVSDVVVSPVSAIARPSPTGRTITCVVMSGPAEYATERPSGESAGRISSPGSQVTCVARPKTKGGAPAPPLSLAPRKNAATAIAAPAATVAIVRARDERGRTGAHGRSRRRDHLRDDRLRRRAGERRLAGEHLEHDAAERVNVGARIELALAHRLFGSCTAVCRATCRSRSCDCRRPSTRQARCRSRRRARVRRAGGCSRA